MAVVMMTRWHFISWLGFGVGLERSVGALTSWPAAGAPWRVPNAWEPHRQLFAMLHRQKIFSSSRLQFPANRQSKLRISLTVATKVDRKIASTTAIRLFL